MFPFFLQKYMSYDMDVELDPNEVLSHLKQMGYHNITGLQLQEFIKGWF